MRDGVAVRQGGAALLVGLRQAEGSNSGSHQEGAAGQDHRGPRVKHQPAV